MAVQTRPERVAPEPIKAIPVRHPGRWVWIAVLAVLTAMFVHLLVTNRSFEWGFVFRSTGPGQRGAMFIPPVLAGLRGTIVLTVLSMLIGIVVGIIVAIMRLSPNPILGSVAWVYTWFFRAVPRLVLAILFGNLGILWARIAFGVPFDRQIGALFGVSNFSARLFSINATTVLSGFVAGTLALGLSEGAYMAEIVRAGIQSVDPGQTEAASALGLSRAQTLRRIVLPQAMRVIVPPTGNETIAMIKDTSLVAFVPVTGELFFQFTAIEARTFKVLPVLVGACLWYLVLCSVMMIIQYFIERHFGKGYGIAGQARQRLADLSAEKGTLTEGTTP